MSSNFKHITITRPDGTLLHININQVVYISVDPADPTADKTLIVTSNDSFIVKYPVEEVLSKLEKGESNL